MPLLRGRGRPGRGLAREPEGEVIRRRRECPRAAGASPPTRRSRRSPTWSSRTTAAGSPSTATSCGPGSSRPARSGPCRPRARRDRGRDRVASARRRGAGDRDPRIGDLVMERLRELDKVAYVRFASVYRQFEDVDEFLNELRSLIGRRREGDRREEPQTAGAVRRGDPADDARTVRFYGPMVELSRLQSELNRLFEVFVETQQQGRDAGVLLGPQRGRPGRRGDDQAPRRAAGRRGRGRPRHDPRPGRR